MEGSRHLTTIWVKGLPEMQFISSDAPIIAQDSAVAAKALVKHDVQRDSSAGVCYVRQDALHLEMEGEEAEDVLIRYIYMQDLLLTIRLRGGHEIKLETAKSTAIAESIAEATLWTERRKKMYADRAAKAEAEDEERRRHKASEKAAKKAQRKQARKNRKAAKRGSRNACTKRGLCG